MNSITVYPATSLKGELTLPGDKSISHRAIIFASLSEGITQIHHLLEGEDVLCTIDCFRALGVPIEKKGEEWIVEGVGLQGLKPPSKILYCGNSGTTLRLLLGVLSAQAFESALTGDASLNRRPLKRVMDPLTQMGAEFRVEGEGTPERKVWVRGGKLKGIHYQSPVASAQVKSAVLLAGLWAKGETSFTEPSLSRDHTEKMLEISGVSLAREKNKIILTPPQKFKTPPLLKIPGDFSSAAFFMVAASLVPNSKIILKEVGLNSTRTGALDILKEMGASIVIKNSKKAGAEEMGDLEISSASLYAKNIGGPIIPRLIDEIPVLTIAAACAQGKTRISEASELKVKESNRIQALKTLLTQIGVLVQEKEDGLLIEGKANSLFKSTSVESFSDHRMAMSMAVAALLAEGPISIRDTDCVKTSFPTFWESLKHLGAWVEMSTNTTNTL